MEIRNMRPTESSTIQLENAQLLPDEAEPSAGEILPSIINALTPAFGVFQSFYRVPHHSDELQFAHFSGELAEIRALSDGNFVPSHPSGFGYSLDLALLKCIGEGLERHSLQIYRRNDLRTCTPRDLEGEVILAPECVTALSEPQRRRLPRFQLSPTKTYSWTSATQLLNGEPILVPAQLIYLSYAFLPNEPIIAFPITTGAAGGSTVTAAIARGIYEIIERDAFMIAYLTKLQVPRIDLDQVDHAPTQTLLQNLHRYHLEPLLFDLTLDLQVPTFMAIVIDRTKVGPALSIGLKSHLHPYAAIYGALLESQHPRGWIRREGAKLDGAHSRPAQPIVTLAQRGLAWFSPSRLKYLDFWLNQHPIPLRQAVDCEPLSDKAQVLRLARILQEARMNVIVKDVTPAHLGRLPYHVIKTLIPELHPLYLDERYPYHGGQRLARVPAKSGLQHARSTSALNRIPHPFL
jgi:ribosomal protein S12 methylthiotransferase accessory factor